MMTTTTSQPHLLPTFSRPSKRNFSSAARFNQQPTTNDQSTSPPKQPPPPPQQQQQQHHQAPTFYNLFSATFPAGPPPQSSFTPDLRQLRREFLQLQTTAHPDHSTSNDNGRHSAVINEAYRTLQDPLRRAIYLLSLHDINVEDESASLSSDGEGEGDAELLMLVMEAREAIDDASSEEEVAELRVQNDERIRRCVDVLEDAFGHADWDRAAGETVRLRYWMNIDESIRGWEKGEGGGIIHH